MRCDVIPHAAPTNGRLRPVRSRLNLFRIGPAPFHGGFCRVQLTGGSVLVAAAK